jgi:hypothetical protein
MAMTKMEKISSEQHLQYLGLLKSNLLSLEFSLRAFLYNHSYRELPKGTVPLGRLENLKVGQLVKENPLTNFDSLGDLIKKYNQRAKLYPNNLIIDKSLIDLRDILAHGRISSDKPQHPMNLLKFARPKNGQVEVTHNIEMNRDWYKEQCAKLLDAMLKVMEAARELKKGL